MKENCEKMLKDLQSFNLPKWEKLPDLDLYMDQVITYMDRELATLVVNSEDKLLTTSMINNYVKGQLLPPPVQKKYSKEHLARMLVISSVKQVLSISDIASILESQANNDKELLYEQFINAQKLSTQNITNEVINTIDNLPNDLSDDDFENFLNTYVIRLAIDAEVKKIVAEKILNIIKENKQEETNKLKDKEQKEKSEKKENKK